MRNNNYIIGNNLFNSNSSINLNKSAHFGNKLKRIRNYSINNSNGNMLRPSTAPHKGDKEKSSKDKKRKQNPKKQNPKKQNQKNPNQVEKPRKKCERLYPN